MNHNPIFIRELGEMRKILTRFAGLWVVITGLMFLGTPPLAMRVVAYMHETLVPSGVSLVALGPLSSFTAPFSIACMTAFIISFPYLLFSIRRYLLPALFHGERRFVSRILFFSLLLFFSGCAFSYFFLIPHTFAILYSFASPLGVTPFFSLDVFIATVSGLTLSAGLCFLIPIYMIALSAIGLVSASAWREHWRVSMLIVIILSAILTPDGSGITMVILSVPLLFLYGVGAVSCAKREESRALLLQ
jgi:sec-independent protein translocase protein TatC